jgi:hypothetical protein
MLQHRTPILTSLLILWQLLLPSGAPWLHTFVDGSCCATTTTVSKQNAKTRCHHHCGKQHGHVSTEGKGSSTESRGESDSEQAPHDCSNCAVCQAIAAPRVLVLLIELPIFSERTELISVIECADPLLGFGLPLQCRAPPVA